MARPAAPFLSDAVDGARPAGWVELADAEAEQFADMLHDGPVQALVLAHFAADAAVRGSDPAAARDAVRSALVELRQTLWHLRPRGSDGTGLPEALRQLSDRLVQAGRPALVLDLDENAAAALEPAVASTAYRLVQALSLGAPRADPVRVALAATGVTALLDISGSPADGARWAARVAAVGGTITPTTTGISVALPALSPRPKAIP